MDCGKDAIYVDEMRLMSEWVGGGDLGPHVCGIRAMRSWDSRLWPGPWRIGR